MRLTLTEAQLQRIILKQTKKMLNEMEMQRQNLWELGHLEELARMNPDAEFPEDMPETRGEEQPMNESYLLNFVTRKWNSPANRMLNENFQNPEPSMSIDPSLLVSDETKYELDDLDTDSGILSFIAHNPEFPEGSAYVTINFNLEVLRYQYTPADGYDPDSMDYESELTLDRAVIEDCNQDLGGDIEIPQDIAERILENWKDYIDQDYIDNHDEPSNDSWF